MQLLVAPVLVSEHATGSVHALLGLVESPAVLRLELLVVAADGSHCELFLPVGETAL